MVSARKTITSPPLYTSAQLWPSLVKEVTWLVYCRWIGRGVAVREEAEEFVPWGGGGMSQRNRGGHGGGWGHLQ
jgi:hypothetical protein